MEGKFTDVLRTMTVDFIGKGGHKVPSEKFFQEFSKGNAVMVDLRSKEEKEIISIPFAVDMPINELPDRYTEIPKDKLVALFCPFGARAAMAFFFLKANGYDNVRIFDEKFEGLIEQAKPGKILKRKQG